MTTTSSNRYSLTRFPALTLLLLMSALAGPGPLTADPRAPLPFSAEYDVYRNGKKIAQSVIELSRTANGQYSYSLETRGKKGLARLLGATDSESASFGWGDDRLTPISYQSSNKVGPRKRSWQASFDWQAGTVTGAKDDTGFELPLTNQALDPVTLKFSLMDATAHGSRAMSFTLLDKDHFEQHNYQAAAEQPLQTAIGCTAGIKIERIREQSTRYTTTWLAPQLAYNLVRLDHGKRDGDQMSMQITRLMIDGQPVDLPPDCPADSGE